MKQQKEQTKKELQDKVIQFPTEKRKKQIEKEMIEICIKECKDMDW